MKEVLAKFLWNGKDTVSVIAVDKFERHGSSSFLGIKGTAGRTEAAVTAERDKFHGTAMRAAVKSAAGIRITAVNPASDIFDFRLPRMQRIDDFFIMVTKDCL